MADNVQFILDRMSSTLRQVERLKLFTSDEVKSIVKKRTDYEYTMKRRQLTPADFYNYLQYELNLDKLRIIRSDYNNAPKEKADAFRIIEGAFLSHISYIFDRSIRRFPSEMSLWGDYISFLKEKKLNSALNAVFSKALSLNPKNEDLWLQASVHELEVNNNLHSTRTLLQRSLRANKISLRLWSKYFELELWNAIRITERQRILGLEVDDAPVHGAPIVVFKHALIALPEEIDFACDLHRSSMNISTPLALSLEAMLLESFGGKVHVWEYLASLSFDRHSVQVDNSDNRILQGRLDDELSQEVKDKKRKRGKGSASDIIEYIARSLDTCVSILDKAEEKIITDNDDKNDIEISKYPLMVVSIIETMLEKACNFIGKISHSHFNKFLNKNENENKKMKKNDSSEEILKKEVSLSVSNLIQSVHNISIIINKNEILNANTKVDKKSTPMNFVSLYDANQTLARHRLWLMLSIIQPSSILSTSNEINCVNMNGLLEWCNNTSKNTKLMFKNKNTFIITYEKEFKELITIWIKIADVALTSAMRSWALKMTTGEEISGEKETLLLVGEMIMNGADIACSISEGCDLVDRCVDIGMTLGCLNVLEKGLKSIISSPYCENNMRGEWCAKLLKFMIAVENNGSKMEILLGKKVDDDDDDDDCERTIIKDKSTCENVYTYVEKVFNNHPELLIHSNLKPYYELLLNLEMKIISLNKLKSYTFIYLVCKKSIEHCPHEFIFWDTYENIERLQGNHKAANHIRWRRDREAIC